MLTKWIMTTMTRDTSKYPTKKQILAEPRPIYPIGLMTRISDWKRRCYRNWPNRIDQRFCQQALVNIITDAYNAQPVYVKEGEPTRYVVGEFDYFIFVKDGSIISLFHELAHHLFGPDELTACRWSVWLYQLRFRKDYNKLVWNKHLLVKPLSSKRVVAQSPSHHKVATIV